MDLPEELSRLLRGRPDVGVEEQAFPFLTVDDGGFPHVCLLSRAEVDVLPDRSRVIAVVASTRTRANLERDGRAGLIAVSGTVAHYAKLAVDSARVERGLFACVLRLVEHKADSIGIPLAGMRFRTTAEIASAEMWQRSEEVLAVLSRTGDRSGG